MSLQKMPSLKDKLEAIETARIETARLEKLKAEEAKEEEIKPAKKPKKGRSR